jgi:hypothetical protein
VIPHFLGRRRVGCPLGDWRRPGSAHPRPSFRRALPHTCVWDGRGELILTLPGFRAPRPVSRGSPGTLAAHHFPAPPPPGFGQVVLPDFASLLRSVSPGMVEPSPGAPRREPDQKCRRRPHFLVCLRDPSPPSRLSLGTLSQPSPVRTRLGRLAPSCLPGGICWNTTQLSPLSWVLSHPRLTGLHLTTASTPPPPDCRPGRVLRLSREVTPFLGAGQSSRTGIGPETRGSPFLGQLPRVLLCPYQRSPLRGIMVSTPRGLRVRHSPSPPRLEPPTAPQTDPIV